MRISEALHDIAATVGPVYYGVAASGATRSITDTTIMLDAGQAVGGMLIVTSGACQGDVAKIVSNRDGTFTIDRDFSDTIAAADTFIVTPLPYHRLLQAFNQAINSGQAILSDASLTGASDTYDFTLPTGVNNVVRVKVEDGGINRYWHEYGSTLNFAKGKEPADGKTITLLYRGRVQIDWSTDMIVSSITAEWLKWAAVAQYWRAELEVSHKDNPIAVDMMNEARQNLGQAIARVKSMDLAPDPRYFVT